MQEEGEAEVELEEMYIELQLGPCGAQVVLPAYAAERGQCSLGQSDFGQILLNAEFD